MFAKKKSFVKSLFGSGSDKSAGTSNKKKKPKLDDFLEYRDFAGALTLLDFSKNTDTPIENHELWKAYCQYRLGEYKRAYDIYYDLLKRSKPDPMLNIYIACCCFYLGMFKEADEYCQNGPDCSLKNRLMMHIMFKLKNEEEMTKYHGLMNDKDIEDHMSVAGLFCYLGNYTEAISMYKTVLSSEKTYLAMHVYIAFCYYKMDAFDACQESISKYLEVHPMTAIGVNLKACNHFRLYDGKSAEGELKHFLENVSNHFYFGEELIKHNKVVFNNGEDALHKLTPLVDVIHEARLNIAIYYLKQDEYALALDIVKGFEPSTSWEYVLKAVIFACVGQQDNNKDYLKKAMQYFQHVGKAPGECDTVLGRQCMASCLFLLKHFNDVLVYLDTIKGYMYSDDHYNYNYGQAKAAVEQYKDAEEAFLLIKSEKIKEDFVYRSWLTKCFIRNKKPEQAWLLYCKMENSKESLSILELIANECYRMGHFYVSAQAFDVLEQHENSPVYWEGKRGACLAVFFSIVSGKMPPENIRDLLALLQNGVSNPQLEYIVRVLEGWATQNRIPI